MCEREREREKGERKEREREREKEREREREKGERYKSVCFVRIKNRKQNLSQNYLFYSLRFCLQISYVVFVLACVCVSYVDNL